MEIRRGKITKKEAIEYIREHEGKFPYFYLDKPLEEILSDINISMEEFIRGDKFTNKKIFKCNSDGTFKKDNNLNLENKLR